MNLLNGRLLCQVRVSLFFWYQALFYDLKLKRRATTALCQNLMSHGISNMYTVCLVFRAFFVTTNKLLFSVLKNDF